MVEVSFTRMVTLRLEPDGVESAGTIAVFIVRKKNGYSVKRFLALVPCKEYDATWFLSFLSVNIYTDTSSCVMVQLYEEHN